MKRRAMHYAMGMPIFAACVARLFVVFANSYDGNEDAQTLAQNDVQTCLQAIEEITIG